MNQSINVVSHVYVVAFFVRLSQQLNIEGMDISEKLIEISKSQNIYNDCLIWNMDDIPFPFVNEKFDAIVSCGVLTYSQDINKLFDEFLRVLKPNGLIVVTHRTDLLEKNDEKYFQQRVDEKIWKELQRVDAFPYLPNNENYSDIAVNCYVLQKLPQSNADP